MSHVGAPATAAGLARPPSLFTLLRRNFWLLFGAVFLTVGVVTMIIGAALVWRENRFAAEATNATGVVMRKSLDRATADRGTEYFVTYRFIDADGVSRDASDELDFTAWDALVEGGPIDVEYLPSDPETSRMARDDWAYAGITLGIGVLAAGIGTALAIPGLRGFRRERRLWSSGSPAWATVTGHEQANVRFNGRYLWHVLYRFEDASGASHEGRSNYLGEAEAMSYAPGSRAVIRYDPTRPRESVWTGSVGEGHPGA